MRVPGVFAVAFEALLPSLCPHCGQSLSGWDVGLCAGCWAAMVPFSGACCPRCGAPSDETLAECLHCAGTPPPYDGAVVWGEYDGVLRRAVLTLKHRQRDELAPPLARLIAARVSLETWADIIDHVTYVPSHRMWRARRGWSAAQSLAHEVAHLLDVPMRSILKRRGLRRQTGRTRAQRLELPKTSFECAVEIHGRRILLVDDVTTTGATLSRAAGALFAAGAEAVFCTAAARTPDSRRMS